MIAVRSLSKRFDAPGGTSIELRTIDLDVPDRTIMAVIGPSGAGKTTLSKCIRLLSDPQIEKLKKAFSDPRVEKYLETTDDPLVRGVLTPVSDS